MRLICPHCMSGVTVPDDAAGTDATCPNCGKAFPTPARYSAQVSLDPPVPPAAPPSPPVPPPEVAPAPHVAPPPGFVPPAPVDASGFLPPATAPQAATPTAEGYTKSVGFSISPKVFSWLPAVLLLVTLVFTCFPWVGSYVGGSAVYSQRPWNAVYGGLTSNTALAKAVKIPTEWRDKLRSDWELMVLYLIGLILAVGFAWADRALGDVPPQQIPPLVKAWPYRHAVILGLATAALLLSGIQVANGFGMERAIRQAEDERFASARQQATGDAARADVEYEVELAYAKYNLERTSWAYLALVCNLLAVIAMLIRYLLSRRGNKPPPKLLLHY